MVDESYIELNTFVKINGHATTGGEAKVLIRSGAVTVNGVVETRNRKKLVVGDVVCLQDKTYRVSSDEIH